MAAPPKSHSIQVTKATAQDIPSLTTILARAFHPVNNFHVRCFPDTPLVRQWWHGIFADEIQDPACRPIAAIDASATDDLRVVGFLTMRLLGADDPGAGLWSMYPPTPDHDAELFRPAIEQMTEYRRKTFGGTGQTHFHIELFGVDHAYKGLGLGKDLLAKACEIADAEGYPMFVQANGFAHQFYQKFGFEQKGVDRISMGEGEPDYLEYALVRPLQHK